MNSSLGYADFVRMADRWTKLHRWPAGLFKNIAGLIAFAALGGFGLKYAHEVLPFYWAVYLLQTMLFVILLGKGSLDVGFNKIVSFFSNLPDLLYKGIERIAHNAIQLMVNILICILVVTIVTIGIQFLSGWHLILKLIGAIPFVNDNLSAASFRAFLNHSWLYPLIISYVAVAVDWAFFHESKDDA